MVFLFCSCFTFANLYYYLKTKIIRRHNGVTNVKALIRSRRLRIGITLFGLGLMFYAWHYFFRLPLIGIHPMEAVSPPVAAVLALPSDQELQSTENPLLAIVASSNTWKKDVATATSFLQKAGLSARRHPAIWVLFQQTGPDAFMTGFIVDMRGKSREVAALLKQSGGQWNESRYQGVQIYHIQTEGGEPISVAQYRNLLLLSKLPIVVESAISQLSRPSGNLFKNSAFRRLGLPRFSGKSLGEAYINVPNLSGIGRAFSVQEAFFPPGTIADWQWIRLEAVRGETGARLVGTLATTSDNALAIALPGQSKQRDNGDWHALTPDNAALLFQTRLSNPGAFFRAFGFSGNDRFRKYVQPWIGVEAIFITLEAGSADTPPEQLWVIRSSDEQKALSKLNEWAKEEGLIKQYDYQAFTISQVLSESLPAGWSKNRRLRNPCYVTAGDYVILAASPAAMERWIDYYTVGKTLAQSASFQQLWGNSNRPANGFWYVNMTALGLSYSTDDALSKATRQIGLLGFSVMANGSTFDISGYSLPDTTQAAAGALVWKTKLPDLAKTAPAVVETGTPDRFAIAVQDMRNQLHLLNRNGDILWSSKLDGPVLGRMQSVDWYGDHRRQLLLNTPKRIYLINLADGKTEANFPLTLQSPAINGMLAVDFEKNNAYSVFVACENGNVYGFDRSGLPLEGWNPLSGAGKVRFQLEHFQHDHKDFIVSLNEKGQLLVFKKDGTFRFPPVETQGAFRSPPAWQYTAAQVRIAATDVGGICHIVNSEGASFRLRLPVGHNEQVAFAFGDLSGDSRYDYAVSSDSLVAVYAYKDKDLQLAFRASLSNAPDSLFMTPIPGLEKAGLGMFNRKNRELMLLLPDGRMHPDFPLSGASAFTVCDLFDNRRRMVVVANEDHIYAYRIR